MVFISNKVDILVSFLSRNDVNGLNICYQTAPYQTSWRQSPYGTHANMPYRPPNIQLRYDEMFVWIFLYVLFQKWVQLFDHGIKTWESNESWGTKPWEIHCFLMFWYHDQTHRTSFWNGSSNERQWASQVLLWDLGIV